VHTSVYDAPSMMNLEGLLKAEYVWTPSRLAQRLLRRSRVRWEGGMCVVPMRWQLSLTVSRLDNVARSVDRLGVHDLVVTETLWRLIEQGDTTIDVGANVGYMTLAMIARMRGGGRVFAFEPHPALFQELSGNLLGARARYPHVEVIARNEALSDSRGTAWLSQPPGFEDNRGLAAIAPHADGDRAGHEVPTRPLDDYAAELGADVALAKIDVEGHEPAVLRGARGLLERGVIRHIVLEEHGRYPTESTRLLESLGYSIFFLERTLLRPNLGEPGRPARSAWEPPNLLATRRPDEVRALFAASGWQSLRG
jgi:FkbM family methyltransferase